MINPQTKQFPFLIGKVLTFGFFNKCLWEMYSNLFPFLIGKVLTVKLYGLQTMVILSFPFLIGKVLTTAFKPL